MTELPKKGDKVKWETPQGETNGTVEKIVTSDTKVKGHVAKATKETPEVHGAQRQVRQARPCTSRRS